MRSCREAVNHLGGQGEHPGRVPVGALGVGRRILLGGEKVDVAVKGQLSFTAEPLGDPGGAAEVPSRRFGKLGLVLEEQAADIVKFGGFDAHGPQHPLEG